MQIAYKIIKEIQEKSTYLELCAYLMKPVNDEPAIYKFTPVLKEITKFTNTLSEYEIIERGPTILNNIEPMFRLMLKEFPIKKDLSVIAKKFNSLKRDHPNFLSLGILYGWLNEILDCTSIYKETIPFHSRVGVYFNAGNFAIEESILLRDSFFFIVLAEKEFLKLETSAKMIEQNGYNQVERSEAMGYNFNIDTYSRNALLNLYSFVEAFVNGVGIDYLYKNKSSLSDKDSETLKGTVGKNNLSLQKKIELFHQIIRNDHKQVLNISDKVQIKEPFITFFNECKSLRDSSVHFSPLKESITKPPKEWINKLKLHSNVCLDVAREFWKACYDTDKSPDYLDLLDSEHLRTIANKRIET